MNLLIQMATNLPFGQKSNMTYQSFDGHGVDVAVKRADDLDKKALEYIIANSGCRVLDVGSGAGGQSLRMAQHGAQVVAVDQFDFSQQFSQYSQSVDSLRFIMGDVRNLSELVSEQIFDISICQRTIHYLPYTAAQSLLKELLKVTQDKLFISVTGCGSLVGDTYLAATEPIEHRFSTLSALGQEMFSIVEPVCLYTQVEFIQLLGSAGWTVETCWESAFGNVKAVCSK